MVLEAQIRPDPREQKAPLPAFSPLWGLKGLHFSGPRKEDSSCQWLRSHQLRSCCMVLEFGSYQAPLWLVEAFVASHGDGSLLATLVIVVVSNPRTL